MHSFLFGPGNVIQFYYNVQIYNEQITDLLDPSQKNLQVKKQMGKHSSTASNHLLILLIYNLFLCRSEKMLEPPVFMLNH
jgi:hypothetical protein